MKKVVHKFYLKHSQNGIVLLFTMFLLLIIATLTITFFGLQFLKVELIAYQTEHIQSFYLAEAGLAQGIRKLNEDPKILYQLEKKGVLKHTDLNSLSKVKLASKKEGVFYYEYEYIEDPISSDIKGLIITTGTGWVTEWENRREIARNFKRLGRRLLPPEDWPEETFGELAATLNYAVVTSYEEPRKWEIITFIEKDRDKRVSGDQEYILTFNEMDIPQKNAYTDFLGESTSIIAKAREINENNNELLFFRNDIIGKNYESKWMENIISSQLGEKWQYPEFDYTEYRSTQGGRTIIKPSMTLKSNKQITLKEGIYFFEELTLEKGSTLNTEGDVLIYVAKLELKENAKLMGGTSIYPDTAKPNDLIIMARGWPGWAFTSEIKIGPTAKVCGHIFAPNSKVFLSRGLGGHDTRVYGSILTYQLITYVQPGQQAAYGPIWVIYSEYLEDEVVDVPGSWREVRNP